MATVSRWDKYLYPQLNLMPEAQAADVLRRAKRSTGRSWKLLLCAALVPASAYYGAFLANRFIPADVVAPITALLPWKLKATAIVFGLLVCGGCVIAMWYSRRLIRAAIAAEANDASSTSLPPSTPPSH